MGSEGRRDPEVAGRRHGVVPADGVLRICERAADDLRSFEDRRVLVTGASGFFGRWLVAALTRAPVGPASLVLVSRNAEAFAASWPEGAADPRVRFVSRDVRDFRGVDAPIDDVFHFATSADAKLNEEAPLEMFDVAFEGTRRVLEWARATRVERFLFASSGAVYGPQPPTLERVREDYLGAPDPTDVRSSYHQAKRAAEHLCAVHSATGGPKCTIARCFAFGGPGLPLDRHFAFGNFVGAAASGKPLSLMGDGRPVRSYLDVEDLIVWLLAILARGEGGRAYNVGSENAVTVRELAERVARLGRVPLEEPRPPEPGHPHRYVPSTERIRTELGVTETVALDECIRRSLEWARLGRGNEE